MSREPAPALGTLDLRSMRAHFAALAYLSPQWSSITDEACLLAEQYAQLVTREHALALRVDAQAARLAAARTALQQIADLIERCAGIFTEEQTEQVLGALRAAAADAAGEGEA